MCSDCDGADFAAHWMTHNVNQLTHRDRHQIFIQFGSIGFVVAEILFVFFFCFYFPISSLSSSFECLNIYRVHQKDIQYLDGVSFLTFDTLFTNPFLFFLCLLFFIYKPSSAITKSSSFSAKIVKPPNFPFIQPFT